MKLSWCTLALALTAAIASGAETATDARLSMRGLAAAGPGTVKAAGAKPAGKTTATASTKTAPAKGKQCKFGAKSFSGLEWVKGDFITPGSIYAVCTDGVPACYTSDGTPDQHKEVKAACPKNVTGGGAAETPKPSTTKPGAKTAKPGAKTPKPKPGAKTLKPKVGAKTPKPKAGAKPKTAKPKAGVKPKTKPAVKPAPKTKPGKAPRRELGVAMPAAYAWPHRVICFEFDATIPAARQRDFDPVFMAYNQAANFNFLTLKQCTAYAAKYKINVCDRCTQAVDIRAKVPGCFATLGYDPKAKRALYMNAEPRCSVRVLTHEMGHVVGLMHEHQHPDREVVIIRSKMSKQVPDTEFAKFPRGHGVLTAYDKASIMHYNEPEICIPKLKHPKNDAKQRWCDIVETAANGCVVPLDSDCDTARTAAELRGNSGVLSRGDIAVLRAMP